MHHRGKSYNSKILEQPFLRTQISTNKVTFSYEKRARRSHALEYIGAVLSGAGLGIRTRSMGSSVVGQ